jgi:hypothetical protein
VKLETVVQPLKMEQVENPSPHSSAQSGLVVERECFPPFLSSLFTSADHPLPFIDPRFLKPTPPRSFYFLISRKNHIPIPSCVSPDSRSWLTPFS